MGGWGRKGSWGAGVTLKIRTGKGQCIGWREDPQAATGWREAPRGPSERAPGSACRPPVLRVGGGRQPAQGQSGAVGGRLPATCGVGRDSILSRRRGRRGPAPTECSC